MWSVKLSPQAVKDKDFLIEAGLDQKAKHLLAILASNPFQTPPSYSKHVGKLDGYYSRKINWQQRLVYRVDEENKIVYIDSMLSHYEK